MSIRGDDLIGAELMYTSPFRSTHTGIVSDVRHSERDGWLVLITGKKVFVPLSRCKVLCADALNGVNACGCEYEGGRRKYTCEVHRKDSPTG